MTAAEFLASTGHPEDDCEGCPCFAIRGDDFTVESVCWRVGDGPSITITGTVDSRVKLKIANKIRGLSRWPDVDFKVVLK